jgi:hypothetical protein
MKYIAFLMILLMSASAYAQSTSLNLSIPSASNSFGSDRFRAGDLDCQNSIGSATNFEFGVTGVRKGENTNPLSSNFGKSSPDVGVYARIVIPLGARPKARINCDTLYQLELSKKRLEILKLQKELSELKALQFEN